MHFQSSAFMLASFLYAAASNANPVITVHNTNTYTLCLKVETGAGYFPTTTSCGGVNGINVAPMLTSNFYPSSKWNGAITPVRKGVVGTRFEIDFSDAGKTWYDADMEMGMSGGTVGPSDNRKRSNGAPSLAGEQDPLAKADAAWAHTANQGELLATPKYITASNGHLKSVYMDKEAPEIVQAFFQLDADFNAYIGPGSESGKPVAQGTLKEQLNRAADEKSWTVDTQEMTITIY
ncbi:MAG: hypothetical protein LQ350_006219 [Teloschistes chrysophthalmus]|nr:MAG: hypothetical protein LQ350_006219 [Niorma chrysophthalma]